LLRYVRIAPFPLYHSICPGNYLRTSAFFLDNLGLTPHPPYRPIEASVALLPLFDFLHLNPVFTRVFLDATSNANEKAYSNRISPVPYTVLSLSSYILTHASSSASRRAMSYANLTMNLLLIMSENARAMETFCQPSIQAIRLCRQVSHSTDLHLHAI